MRLPLARYGIPELLIFSALFGAMAWVAWASIGGASGLVLAAIPLLLLAFCFNFFRDPERTPPADASLAVAPADGLVTDVMEVPQVPFIGGPALRIGIFLNVFDVHVNRSPVSGTVAWLRHRPGLYLDARDPACADDNEAQDLGLMVDDGAGGSFPVLVRQIAGLIARRIVCRAEEGRRLARGERYGMIKFGSRTELYLPPDRVASVEVAVGARVKGGRDAVARLRLEPAAAAGAAR